jgi:Ras-related protein Rab-2A
MTQLTEETFASFYNPTIGVEFGSHICHVAHRRVKLLMWDLSGDVRFSSIVRSYYRGVIGVLLVFDVTRRATFDHAISTWLQEARHYTSGLASVTLVGNKCDSEDLREVTEAEAKQFAVEQRFVGYFETSALSDTNVEVAFAETARHVLRRRLPGGDLANNHSVNIRPHLIQYTSTDMATTPLDRLIDMAAHIASLMCASLMFVFTTLAHWLSPRSLKE